jgi:hypothetical protein
MNLVSLGTYIDQIAAAGPRNCWDPTHNHTSGGGHYWVDGYRKLLEKARQGSKKRMILTESNAEPFMDGNYNRQYPSIFINIHHQFS